MIKPFQSHSFPKMCFLSGLPDLALVTLSVPYNLVSFELMLLKLSKYDGNLVVIL